MPASDDRHLPAPPGPAAAAERLERRVLAAADAPAPFVPLAAEGAAFHLTLNGSIDAADEEDWFSLGRLRAGDVLSVALSAADSARGTLLDPYLELYRAAGNPEKPLLVTRNDDGGSGKDALILRRALAADDTYFIKAKAGFGTWTGGYAVSARLERDAGEPPATGGALAAESEPNGSATTANDASASWQKVEFRSSQQGAIGSTTAAEYAYSLRAGDVVTVVMDSTSELDGALSLVGEADAEIFAVDAGDGMRGSNDARDAEVIAFRVPRSATYRVRVHANSRTTGAFRLDVYLSRKEASVVARRVFYNNSFYDGRSPAAAPSDDAAIAPDKVALRLGERVTAANVTSFSQGINGVMIDMEGMPQEFGGEGFDFAMSSTAASGTWVVPPAPSVSRRPGAGTGGSDRFTLVWPDGAVVNRWLRVTVKATDANGLAADDVFLFGNLVGDTGDDTPLAAVTAADVVRTRAAVSSASPALTTPFDFNRDGRVNAFDQAAARANVGRSLPPPFAPAASAIVSHVPAPIPRPRSAAPRRLWYETHATSLP